MQLLILIEQLKLFGTAYMLFSLLEVLSKLVPVLVGDFVNLLGNLHVMPWTQPHLVQDVAHEIVPTRFIFVLLARCSENRPLLSFPTFVSFRILFFSFSSLTEL